MHVNLTVILLDCSGRLVTIALHASLPVTFIDGFAFFHLKEALRLQRVPVWELVIECPVFRMSFKIANGLPHRYVMVLVQKWFRIEVVNAQTVPNENAPGPRLWCRTRLL